MCVCRRYSWDHFIQSAGPHTASNAFPSPRAPVIANSLVSITPTIDSLLAPSKSVCPAKSDG